MAERDCLTYRRDSAQGFLRDVARARGAAEAYLVACGREELLASLVACGADCRIVAPLSGVPVHVEDLRERGEEARREGWALVADVAWGGPDSCAAERLGAHLSVTQLSPELCLLALARDVRAALPEVDSWLTALSYDVQEEGVACAMAAEADGRWHASSDEAQVVASYLRCHPQVCAVRYPGLRVDPSFAVAARILQGGFGPLVDYRLDDGSWRRVICHGDDPRATVELLEKQLRDEGGWV